MKNLFNKILAAVFVCVLVFSFAACKNQPDTEKDPQPQKPSAAVLDVWNDYIFEKEEGFKFIVSGNKVTKTADSNYNSTAFEVSEGERYLVSFAVKKKGEFGVIMADGETVVYKNFLVRNDGYNEYNSAQVTVPSGAKTLIINSLASKEITIQKLEKLNKAIKEEDMLPSTLKLACVNCGKFDYGDGVTDIETYKAEWKKLVAEANADIFMFEDIIDNFTSSEKVEDMLSLNGKKFDLSEGAASCIRAQTVYSPRTIAIVPVDYIIEGSTKTCPRFYAVRYTFAVNGKQLAVYGLHLVAESHISEEKQADGTSLSQKLRQIQFAGLIKDAQNYDYSIFMGDFNAQQGDEYSVFEKNGYTICNGSKKYGTLATLRNIPADNIIVSSGITVSDFSVNGKDKYNLNTDHSPLFATVVFG